MNLLNTIDEIATRVVPAFLAGLIPALLWLWFWLHEDNQHPEPKKLIAYAFIAGMATVPLVVPFQLFFHNRTSNIIYLFFAFAFIEEIFKFIIAYIVVLRRKEDDEPIDALIYLITIALGFAALENAMYIFTPFDEGNILLGFALGNFRFIGSTLLHTLASSVIGIFMAFSFYKGKIYKSVALAIGLVFAVVLHTLFNLSIIVSNGNNRLIAFYGVWFFIVIVILLFEKIKTLKATN